MDELWQRYRTFWTPVLIGLGIFLVGVIAVHVISDDPEAAAAAVRTKRNTLTSKVEPSRKKVQTLQERARDLQARNVEWARRLDQTNGVGGDVVPIAVDQILRSAILRGAREDAVRAFPRTGSPEAKDKSALAVRYFNGDGVAAERALIRFDKVSLERVALLHDADPNVGFSRLLIDVWNELRVRANRADVALRADRLGFASVSSVTGATLPQYLLNLALVARVTNEAIEGGMESVDQIQIDRPTPSLPDAFMLEWGVRFVMTGPFPAAKRVLDLATDPESPLALHQTSLSLPKGPRAEKTALSGRVELSMKAFSVLVRPENDLGLDAEEDE